MRRAGLPPTFAAQTQTHGTMESAPNSELEQLRLINKRFNEQLDYFDQGVLKECFNLGRPLALLRACGLPDADIMMTAKVLKTHLRKHGLSTGDIKNLAIALQEPMMVYEWGSKAKSLIVITNIEVADGRKVTAAIKLERQGRKLEVNELVSIHGKDMGQLIFDMSVREKDFGRNKLRYVDKKKTLDWLGIAPPKGASSLTRQEFSESRSRLGIAPPKGASSLTEATIHIAKIIQNFENPAIP